MSRQVITPRLLESVRVSSWTDARAPERTGVLLIAGGDDTPTSHLTSLARTLRLTRVGNASAGTDGPKLTVDENRAILTVTADMLLAIPVGPRWSAFVRAGFPAIVAVGAAPLPVGATLARTHRYLTRTAASGLLYRGRARPS